MLSNFVDVNFWENFDVECRQKAENICELHFVSINGFVAIDPPLMTFTLQDYCSDVQLSELIGKNNHDETKQWTILKRSLNPRLGKYGDITNIIE